MNKEQLQNRIAAISAEMVQTKANYSKLEGHLAESQHWLQDLVMKEANDGLAAQAEELLQEQVCAEEVAA